MITYALNKPKVYTKEIPVTYLLNEKTMQLAALDIGPHGTDAVFSYMQAEDIFAGFIKQSEENKIKLTKLAQNFMFSAICFRDFTEYLIVDYLGRLVPTDEAERMLGKQGVQDWFGFSPERIRGEILGEDSIEGDYKENLFLGIHGRFFQETESGLQFHFARDSKIIVKREGMQSTISIKNTYIRISLVIQYLSMSSQGLAFPAEDALQIVASKEDKEGPFRPNNVIIYYKVEPNKWWYSDPRMKDYERWAESMFSVLER